MPLRLSAISVAVVEGLYRASRARVVRSDFCAKPNPLTIHKVNNLLSLFCNIRAIRHKLCMHSSLAIVEDHRASSSPVASVAAAQSGFYEVATHDTARGWPCPAAQTPSRLNPSRFRIASPHPSLAQEALAFHPPLARLRNPSRRQLRLLTDDLDIEALRWRLVRAGRRSEASIPLGAYEGIRFHAAELFWASCRNSS